ncbi:hypothetical protein BU26DRAFT_416336, partial [Trematosphaeria pertusa]
INSLDLKNIHLVVLKFVLEFVAEELRLYLNSYEFSNSLLPVSLYNVDNNNYIKKVADYITRNNLVNIITLKFLDLVKDT